MSVPMVITHVQQINATGTNVLDGTLGGKAPAWAKRVHVWCFFSDYDATFTLKVGDSPALMDASAPHAAFADNAAVPDYNIPHAVANVQKDDVIDLDVVETTAGEGIVIVAFTR